MKKVLFIMMIGMMFGQIDTISLLNESPCNNEKYLQLKEIEIETMSELEFKNFILMSNDCSNYNTFQALNDSINSKVNKIPEKNTIIKNYNTYKRRGLSLLWFLILHNNIHKM